jgi:hypothetical protein
VNARIAVNSNREAREVTIDHARERKTMVATATDRDTLL